MSSEKLSNAEAADNRIKTIKSVEVTDPELLEFRGRMEVAPDNLKAGLVEQLFTQTRTKVEKLDPNYVMQVAKILLDFNCEQHPFENQARILASYANGESEIIKASRKEAQKRFKDTIWI